MRIRTRNIFLRLPVVVRRHWQRFLKLRQKVQFSEEAFHLLLAGAVGVIGGLVNLFFYLAVEAAKEFFLRHPGDPVEVAEMMGGWGRLLTPAFGGLLAGLVLYFGLKLAGPQRSSNILEVVVAGDGRLPLRSAVVKFLSSLVTIGTGGSIGREGGIVQLSATLASKLGQAAKWPPYRLRLLVGCGAASGIAAAYNAPIAGAVFASLIVLGNFSMNLFAPLVFSSVVATMITRTFFGIKSWYEPPAFEFTSVLQLPWFVLLGVVTGLMGSLFLRLLKMTEELFLKMKAPIYLRLALGGVLVGIIAIGFPGVWGNGYVVTNRILHNEFMAEPSPWLFLLGLLLAKLLATLATVGSGAVGGVFTPTLFLGASLGATFGLALNRLGLTQAMPVAVFAVVGMGSMLSATTRSPLLAMIMIFEMSLDYSLMPALMLACVVSILVAQRFHPDSIYTEPLRRKGLGIIHENTQPGTATERTVGDLMQAPVPPLRENATLKQMAAQFLTSSNNFLPVVDAHGHLLGMVALQDLKEHLQAGEELSAVIACDVMRPPPACVTPNQRLLEALPFALASEQRNIPVVDALKSNRLIGALSRAEVLNLFSEAIAAGSKPHV
ncbi:MAG: ClcB-like voltage-gated chloride channel protein [Verrucomicrobiota bacterium]